MNILNRICLLPVIVSAVFATTAIKAESSTNQTVSAAATPKKIAVKYKADDGRTIDIGKNSASDGGLRFRNPHMEKDKCWLADGFDFNGYDTLYIAPTESTAKFQKDEEMPHQLAKENLVIELARALGTKGVFKNIVTKESDIKAGARTLKLENTIIEYSKGGGAARFFVGLYGGGQPVLRVQGKLTDGSKTVFTFEARRSGVSAGARMSGGTRKDVDIQLEDIRSMVLDLTDFAAAIAGKYEAK